MSDAGSSNITVTAKPAAPAPSMTTFRPQISVLLRKNITRANAGPNIAASQRFQGAKGTIDLTPYLGESGSVSVTRSTRQPAGQFSITIADMEALADGQADSYYGIAEPMDVIEIRMARDTSLYSGFTLNMPLIMRGFVSSVRRNTVMTDRGPRRTVTIAGEDYGKILQILQIIYFPTAPDRQNLLTSFNLFTNYGVDTTIQDASAFIQQLLTNVVNGGSSSTPGFLSRMQATAGGGTSPVLFIQSQLTSGTGSVAPFGTQDSESMTIYDLMKKFGDVGPWNELFMTDTESGPVLVYRPNPFTDLSGNVIQPLAEAPTPITIYDREVVELSVERSDDNVANYYWADAPQYANLDATLLEAAAAGDTGDATYGDQNANPYQDTYPNSNPDLYGTRVMRAQSQQGARIDGQQADDYAQAQPSVVKDLAAKRLTIIVSNRDNIVLEHGSMTLRGNEAIRHGETVNLARGAGGLVESYYAHTVTHRYMPMRVFLTDVQFDRGMGFVSRIQREGGSAGPYTSEMNLGGAYGASAG